MLRLVAGPPPRPPAKVLTGMSYVPRIAPAGATARNDENTIAATPTAAARIDLMAPGSPRFPLPISGKLAKNPCHQQQHRLVLRGRGAVTADAESRRGDSNPWPAHYE